MRNAGTAARSVISVIALAAAASATPAGAQEYCVACTGPNALYRCVIEHAVPTGMPLQFLCVKTLAQQGGHATCSVRSGTVFECDAPITRINAASAAARLREPAAGSPVEVDRQGAPSTDGLAPAAPSRPGRADGPLPDERSRPGPEIARPRQPEEPKTVEALAKDISRSSKESLDKAGKAIKGTAKKTWDCIASFFKSC